MTTDLHEIYRRVCEKRPEAAYDGLYPPHTDTPYSGWVTDGIGYVNPSYLTEKDAESLICSHWLGLVKCPHTLLQDEGGAWNIAKIEGGSIRMERGMYGHEKPLGAIAAYLERTP